MSIIFMEDNIEIFTILKMIASYPDDPVEVHFNDNLILPTRLVSLLIGMWICIQHLHVGPTNQLSIDWNP